MPWPGRVLLGCLGSLVVVSVPVVLLFGLNNAFDRLGGFAFLVGLFAAIVVPIILYQNSHAWILERGFIKGRRSEYSRLAVRSVLLEREVWPGGRGSTDGVFVVTDGRPGRIRIIGVYNWEGSESRLASGGKGSWARSGPKIPTASAPLLPMADVNLMSAVSEAAREIVDLIVRELAVPLEFACVEARQAPDVVD